jgi:hypothetical protein
MLGGDLGGGTPRDLAPDAARFQQSNRQPGLAEQIGGSGAYNSRTNDRYVRSVRTFKPWIGGSWRRRCPTTLRLAGEFNNVIGPKRHAGK